MPALVLADIGMPGMDGYAICRTIRDLNFEHLPVILVSGKGGYYEEDLGQAAGASGFITKPFGPETLMKTVENFLAAAPNH
jgi:twitching motility two-component system response regulator PilG